MTSAFSKHLNGLPSYTYRKSLDSDNFINLASNENNYGPSPYVQKRILSKTRQINHYPDPKTTGLRSIIAELNQIDPEQVLPENGSDQLIALIIRCLDNSAQQSNVVFSSGTFQAIKIQAAIHDIAGIEVPISKSYHVDLDNILQSINTHTKLIYIANPNNPTGTAYDIGHLEAFFEKVPISCLILLDEAYFEYAKTIIPHISDAQKLLSRFRNLIMLRTFSKAYGLAGLRVGYAMADPSILRILRKVKTPFSPNSLALAAAESALEDQEYLENICKRNQLQLLETTERLDSSYWRSVPSVANFIYLEDIIDGSTHRLYEYLLEHNIITRPTHGFGLPQGLRISIGTQDEMHTFYDVLKRLECSSKVF